MAPAPRAAALVGAGCKRCRSCWRRLQELPLLLALLLPLLLREYCDDFSRLKRTINRSPCSLLTPSSTDLVTTHIALPSYVALPILRAAKNVVLLALRKTANVALLLPLYPVSCCHQCRSAPPSLLRYGLPPVSLCSSLSTPLRAATSVALLLPLYHVTCCITASTHIQGFTEIGCFTYISRQSTHFIKYLSLLWICLVEASLQNIDCAFQPPQKVFKRKTLLLLFR